jgi:hypothetical protein
LIFPTRVLLEEVGVQVLKDKVQFMRGEENLFEFDDIGVAEFAERFNLSEFEAFLPVVVLLLHFFDGHYFVVLRVEGLEDSSESSVAQHIDYLIFLHPL